MMLAAGVQVAGYRIERLLGSGGMGTVYLATQISLNRPVALKMLPHELPPTPRSARFAREGEVQAALDHPHIVPVHEAGDSERVSSWPCATSAGRRSRTSSSAGELASRTHRPAAHGGGRRTTPPTPPG